MTWYRWVAARLIPTLPSGAFPERRLALAAGCEWGEGKDAAAIMNSHDVRLFAYQTRGQAERGKATDEVGRRGCVAVDCD